MPNGHAIEQALFQYQQNKANFKKTNEGTHSLTVLLRTFILQGVFLTFCVGGGGEEGG